MRFADLCKLLVDHAKKMVTGKDWEKPQILTYLGFVAIAIPALSLTGLHAKKKVIEGAHQTNPVSPSKPIADDRNFFKPPQGLERVGMLDPLIPKGNFAKKEEGKRELNKPSGWSKDDL